MTKLKKLKLFFLGFLLGMACGPVGGMMISMYRDVEYRKGRVAEDFSGPYHDANIAAINRPFIYGICIGGLSLLGLSIAGMLIARENTSNKSQMASR